MRIEMPIDVEHVINTLKNNGHDAYIVGGCVRDSIMNRIPNDWDITTSATPDEVINLFDKTIPTGLKHGTITVVIADSHIEVTTFRIDGKYSDNRKPDEVTFTNSLEEDLKRRDFTINAMVYNHEEGLIDIFNGQQDIESGLIKFVGEAEERIEEDALRMLRAVRFCSQLKFRLDICAFNAIDKNGWKLVGISGERIAMELNKILLSDRPSIGIQCLENTGLLGEISYELEYCDIPQNNPYHVYGVLKHLKVTTDCIENKLHLRLAALLHDIGKPYVITTDENHIDHFYDHAKTSADMTRVLLRRLRYDNKTVETVCKLVYNHDRQISNTETSIKRTLNRLDGDVQLFRDLIELKIADSLAQNPVYTRERLKHANDILVTLDKIIEQEQAFKVSQLNINGNDLIKIGFKGREIGDILNVLLEQVITGRLPNTYDRLFEFSKLSFSMNNLNKLLDKAIYENFESETKHLQHVQNKIND